MQTELSNTYLSSFPSHSPTLPIPTKSPETEPPTLTPTTAAPATGSPVTPAPMSPTESPTMEPTSSRSPTYEPTTPAVSFMSFVKYAIISSCWYRFFIHIFLTDNIICAVP